jgi:riboflavin kinase/FMN adenylyltransferase
MKQKKIFALGFFDGVHLGHQALLRICCQLAADRNCLPAAVTFPLPPGAVLLGHQPNMITSITERKTLLQQYGMEDVRVLSADEKTFSMEWQDFLEMLLEEGAAGFVCGEDYRFGKNGAGNAQSLSNFAAALGLPCVIVPEQTMDGEKISSTRIRTLLERGDVETANRLLGHPHVLTGIVEHGKHLGRTIGIPTANLFLPAGVLTPAFGVYACTVKIGDRTYVAVTNIGTRPTVNGQGITIEPWILDFSGDLYGTELTLFFHKFLRPEQKFSSLDELKAQINEDATTAYQFLK